MDDKEIKASAWKEYTGKANNFANWFTAVIISIFVYLIKWVDEKEKIQPLLEVKTDWWIWSFWVASLALAATFFHKILGVWAAKIRVDWA